MTGKTGRRVVAHLERRGHRARAASRSGPTPFDWGDERTWAAAIKGAEAAYVVDSQQPAAAEQLEAFAALGVQEGVRRSCCCRRANWAVSGGEARLGGERALTRSGADWTILRPTWFMQNFSEGYLRDPIMEGRLVLSAGGGRAPFVDAEDIAAVAAAALTEDGHAGKIYALSGPDLLSFGDVTAAIAAASGRSSPMSPSPTRSTRPTPPEAGSRTATSSS